MYRGFSVLCVQVLLDHLQYVHIKKACTWWMQIFDQVYTTKDCGISAIRFNRNDYIKTRNSSSYNVSISCHVADGDCMLSSVLPMVNPGVVRDILYVILCNVRSHVPYWNVEVLLCQYLLFLKDKKKKVWSHWYLPPRIAELLVHCGRDGTLPVQTCEPSWRFVEESG